MPTASPARHDQLRHPRLGGAYDQPGLTSADDHRPGDHRRHHPAEGFAGTPIIELDGASAGTTANGLTITAGSSTVRGLVINRFGGDGISITGSGASNNAVLGNFIGTNAAGTAALGNGTGVVIDNGASNNTIGGTGAARAT